jgi:hypothetical protein
MLSIVFISVASTTNIQLLRSLAKLVAAHYKHSTPTELANYSSSLLQTFNS